MSKRHLLIASTFSALMTAGCGGGGGGGVDSTPIAPTNPTTPSTPSTPTTPITPTTPTTNYNDSEYNASNSVANATNAAKSANAIVAYNAGATGAGVKIAIIDSGLTDARGEFTGRIDSASKDIASNRGYGDDEGHGTAVAAVAAAGRNGSRILGVAFNATVLALRTDQPGSCDGDGCTHLDSVLASAVDYARANNARVINLSLGGSTMNSVMRAAIRNATAAGIIVVISAGNCGEVSTDCTVAQTNPDPFARVASTADANGLVIIAGSHDPNHVFSSFSNPAGAYGQYYLTALGDHVLSFDNHGSSFIYTGTSFSAPAISGAVALLAQAFPNLTGTQIVDLLMTSADDAGAAGTDSVYGGGVLNLTRAFQPQGSTALAGSAIPVSLTDNGLLSAPMGDANVSGSGAAVFLDSYGRAYQLQLGGTVRHSGVARPLVGALGQDVRRSMTDFGTGSVTVSLADGSSKTFRPERWAGLDALHLSSRAEDRPHMLGGAMRMRLGAKTEALASFGDRVERDSGAGASWLVAEAPGMSTGFGADRSLSLGVRRAVGEVLLTAVAESGNVPASRNGQKQSDYTLVTLTGERRFGPVRLSGSIGLMREDGSVLGARLSNALGGGGATTRLADIDVALALGGGWQARGQLRKAWTDADTGGLLTDGQLRSNAFAFDLSYQGAASRIGLRIAQPMRVASSRYMLNLPTSYDYSTSQAGYALTALDLAPKGRELDVEANYGWSLLGGWMDTNVYLRREAGNIAAMPDDLGAAVRFSLGL